MQDAEVAGTYSSLVVLMHELGFSANTMTCLDSDMNLYWLMSIDVGSMVWDSTDDSAGEVGW
jgi:hypothetical protein